MSVITLEYIIAVDTYRSFGAAAEACFVTQPTLSMQIQKFEEQVGGLLFDRSKQPVVPTALGIEVIAQARKVVVEYKKIFELAKADAQKLTGELKIAIIPTLAPYLLPLFLENWKTKYPGIHLHIYEWTTEEILHKIKKGLVDAALLATPLNDAQIEEQVLFYEPFVTYLAPKHPLLKKKVLLAKDIEDQEIWLLQEGHCFRNQVQGFCHIKSAKQEGMVSYEAGSLETLKSLVDSGTTMTLLPQLAIKNLNAKELDRVRYFKSPEPAREISLITYRYHLNEKFIRIFYQEIKNQIPKDLLDKKNKAVYGIE